jgi:hypothetical protein
MIGFVAFYSALGTRNLTTVFPAGGKVDWMSKFELSNFVTRFVTDFVTRFVTDFVTRFVTDFVTRFVKILRVTMVFEFTINTKRSH